MHLTAKCSADSSHVIKVDKWSEDNEPLYYRDYWVDYGAPSGRGLFRITHCPRCGAPVKIVESDCIPARDYGKLTKCETCCDRLTCAGDAHGDSGMPHETEEE
jgi:hypothetical protein